MLLAIETSGRGAGLALAAHQGLRGSAELATGVSTAAGLVPAIDHLLAAEGLTAADLRAVAVTVGPGSFTGLRVGVTTAKTLAYATGAALIGVDTLQVVAEQAPADAGFLWALLDAQRGQLYAAPFEREASAGWVCVRPAAIVDVADLLAALPRGSMISGPGCESIAQRVAEVARLAPRSSWAPRAETVARIGLRRWQAGGLDDPWRLAPRYVRRAAAEEKAEARRRGVE